MVHSHAPRVPESKVARSTFWFGKTPILFFPILRVEQLVAPRIVRLCQGIFARLGNGGIIILSITIVLQKCNA